MLSREVGQARAQKLPDIYAMGAQATQVLVSIAVSNRFTLAGCLLIGPLKNQVQVTTILDWSTLKYFLATFLTSSAAPNWS